MKQLLLASTAMLLAAGPAIAGQRSSALSADDHSHIKVFKYSPTKRYDVTGLVGQPTTFTFSPDEQVYSISQTNIKGGEDTFEAPWRAPKHDPSKDNPLGRNLTLWPMQEGTTILAVTTVSPPCKSESPISCVQTTYAFRLIAKPDPTGMPDDPEAVFNVLFDGGRAASKQTAAAADGDGVAPGKHAVTSASDDPPPRKRRSHQETTREANERELAEQRLRTDAFNQAGGCHYHGQGDINSPIKPFCALDNGIWTWMRFPGLSQKPTVYIGACDGNERLPRQVGSGDAILVQEIAPVFCLRLESYALNVINDAYNPAGAPTGNGTISTGTQRQILQESATK